MISGFTADEKYDRYVRGIKTQIQGKVRVRDPMTIEAAMLIAERNEAIFFPSRGRVTRKYDSYTRVH